jgi:hypothetical protein
MTSDPLLPERFLGTAQRRADRGWFEPERLGELLVGKPFGAQRDQLRVLGAQTGKDLSDAAPFLGYFPRDFRIS